MILASCRRNWGGIAFANIYEVPKNKNPQPAMGKLVGEIMIDFASIRKYPIGFFSNFGTFMYLSLRRPLSAKEKSMLFHP